MPVGGYQICNGIRPRTLARGHRYPISSKAIHHRHRQQHFLRLAGAQPPSQHQMVLLPQGAGGDPAEAGTPQREAGAGMKVLWEEGKLQEKRLREGEEDGTG